MTNMPQTKGDDKNITENNGHNNKKQCKGIGGPGETKKNKDKTSSKPETQDNDKNKPVVASSGNHKTRMDNSYASTRVDRHGLRTKNKLSKTTVNLGTLRLSLRS